jgi:hypothetical protein
MTPPIAYAELIPPGPGHREWFLWVVLDCPYCHQRHTHGAGADGTTDGHRGAHCSDGLARRDPGYVIVKADPDTAREIAAGIAQRIADRKAEAAVRKQARREQRAQLADRRNAGLAKRHAAKLARTERDEQP